MTVVPKTFKLVEEGTLTSQGTYSQILMTNFNLMGWRGGGGGSNRGSYFIPKKLQLHNLSTQEIHYFFQHTPKNPLVLFCNSKESLWFFFTTQKNPCVFHRPKKNHSDPPPPPPLSLKYVSGAPGPNLQGILGDTTTMLTMVGLSINPIKE